VSDAHEIVRGHAATLLEGAGVMLPEWEVRRCEPQDERSVRLEIGPREGGRCLMIQWAEPGDEPFRGFKVGAQYGAAYLTAADGWDVGDPSTPEEIRQAAFRICACLADADGGVSLVTPPEDEPTALEALPFGPQAIERLLDPHLRVGDPLCDGWRLETLLDAHEDEVHLVFSHDDVPVRLRLVLTPGDVQTDRGLQIQAFPRMGIHRPWTLEAHESALTNALRSTVAAAPEGLTVGPSEG
jgi:hypothetical protein